MYTVIILILINLSIIGLQMQLHNNCANNHFVILRVFLFLSFF